MKFGKLLRNSTTTLKWPGLGPNEYKDLKKALRTSEGDPAKHVAASESFLNVIECALTATRDEYRSRLLALTEGISALEDGDMATPDGPTLRDLRCDLCDLRECLYLQKEAFRKGLKKLDKQTGSAQAPVFMRTLLVQDRGDFLWGAALLPLEQRLDVLVDIRPPKATGAYARAAQSVLHAPACLRGVA